MKKAGLSVAVAATLMMVAQPVWATRMPIHDAAESSEYGRKFGGMLGRGVLNVGTSFVDLLVDTANETRNGPPVVGTLVGVGKGAGCMTLRALSGGVDLLTFWVPGFNGIPVSDSYENCLDFTSSPSARSSMPSTSSESSWREPASSSSTSAPSMTQPPKEERPQYTK